MSTLEVEPISSPEYSDIVTGTALLEQQFGHDPEVLALNVNLGLISGLRGVEAALSTGKDVHILGVESLELLETLFDRMADPEAPIGYRVSLSYLAEKAEVTIDQMRAVTTEYGTAIKNYRKNSKLLSRQQRQDEIDNLRPMTYYLLQGSESYVDTRLDDSFALPCEGGNDELFEPDLLREACDPYHLAIAFDPNAGQTSAKSGYTGQVQRRLFNQAVALGMAEPYEIPTQ
jgi:hypothetical protein